MKPIYYLPLILLTALTACHKTSVPPSEQPLVIHLMDRPAPVDTLWKCSPKEVFEMVLFSSPYTQTTDSIIVHSDLPELCPFSPAWIESVRYAFANHHPLVVNPDVLWLIIERGFSLHVQNHAEQLRNRFVSFDGKKELTITCLPGLIYNSNPEEWEHYFPMFTDSLEAMTKGHIVQNLLCDFSTTTPATLVASQIGVMSALQKYFNYTIVESCGIPDIYLEGTAEDWYHLADKAHKLRAYDLDWWLDDLEPIIRKIAESAEGKVDLDFWKAMYKQTRIDKDEEEFYECGPSPAEHLVDGWVLAFYPYMELNNDTVRVDRANFNDSLIAYLPLDYCSAPLKYRDLAGNTSNLVLAAGIVGFSEDSFTRAIRPQVGWAISHADAAPFK